MSTVGYIVYAIFAAIVAVGIVGCIADALELRIHRGPFRIGMATFWYGGYFVWRGQLHVFGPRSNAKEVTE